MIQVEKLIHSVDYADQTIHILKDISFSIKKGESVAITGSSGSGKTTLLGLLAGLDVPSQGSITVEGQKISSLSEDDRALFRGKNVGFVFQSFHLLPSLTAVENVALPLELMGDEQATQKARQLLEQVGLLHRLTHYPAQLSGGEQQRVAIARAFATNPKYLFADEPTGNLDAKTGTTIIELLFDLNRQYNTTLILVTHEQRLAELCQRQLIIEAGELSEKNL
jgi:putative ABC transport system ATP-binding protein